MKDLCQICKNFKICPQGEGGKLNPSYGVLEYWKNGEFTEDCMIVECDKFRKLEE